MNKLNKKIKRTVKSVTVFCEAKTAPLLPAAYFGVTFQKSILRVMLLKDDMKTKEYRVSSFPFSCISTTLCGLQDLSRW